MTEKIITNITLFQRPGKTTAQCKFLPQHFQSIHDVKVWSLADTTALLIKIHFPTERKVGEGGLVVLLLSPCFVSLTTSQSLRASESAVYSEGLPIRVTIHSFTAPCHGRASSTVPLMCMWGAYGNRIDSFPLSDAISILLQQSKFISYCLEQD